MEPMLTVPEAARYLRISRAQLYALIQQKKIPHIRLSEKRVVIRAADLEQWVGRPQAGRAGISRAAAAPVSSGSRPAAVWGYGGANLSNELEEEGITTYLETRRRGGHLWFFFAHSHEGSQVRAFGKGVISNHRVEGVELYPKQDRLCGGPGSLVKLPFGIHKRSGHRYPFIYRDGSWLAPTVREHIEVLSAHKSVPADVFGAYATY